MIYGEKAMLAGSFGRFIPNHCEYLHLHGESGCYMRHTGK